MLIVNVYKTHFSLRV